jgi:hypothetical protein
MSRLTTTASVRLLVACAIFLVWTARADAVQLGNPAPDLKQKDLAIGLGLSDHRTTAFLDWGITEPGVLRFLAGTFDAGFNTNGTEVGVGYRHNLGPKFNIGELPTRLGVLAQFQMASVKQEFRNPITKTTESTEFKTNIIDLGFGGAITPVTSLNVYAAGVYERAQYDQSVPLFGRVSATDSKLGVLLGVEYWIAPSLLAGLELHPGLFDDDVSIYGAFKF